MAHQVWKSILRYKYGMAKAHILKPKTQMIFIIGTGRSGTHWLGHILESHPDIMVDIEKRPLFDWVTQCAINRERRADLVARIVKRYRAEHALAYPKHYADKSHPNLWLADELAASFPRALFLGIKRSAYATVASMLQHKGVLNWIHRWNEFPVPNEFLGITEENASTYASRSLATKCAMRWLSHMQRLDSLTTKLGDRIKLIRYEDLQLNTQSQVDDLSQFLNMKTPIMMPKIQKQSLEKWKSQLSKDEIFDISGVIRDYQY